MLFQSRFVPGILEGSVTLSFRCWSGPRVVPGGRYRVGGAHLIEVDAVERVSVRDLSDRAARRAGFADRGALLDYLKRTAKRPLRPSSALYRVSFHYAGPDDRPGPDRSADLSAAELEALRAVLEGMDRRSRCGPWTRRTLEQIGRQPRVAASRLAAAQRRETQPFKANVRKLKKLGLTISHELGYELSPRGRALLERT